ncbi:MAG: hypothetical protein AAGF94_08220 [Pseudomonadota bacterium]
MAKRKYPSLAALASDPDPSGPLETKSAASPIDHMAGAAAEQAGLIEDARALTEAREEGRDPKAAARSHPD